MKSARLRPMVETEPCALPKWKEATPCADGLARVAQRRQIIRSAPTALAVAARSASKGLRFVGRDRNVSMPIAVIRPSRRLAKSHNTSASLIGPAAPWVISPWSAPPRPGSTDQFLFTDRMQRATGYPGTEKVQGAQRFRAADAVGVEPVLTLVRHQPVVGLQAGVSVDQPGVKAEILQSVLQRGDVVTVHRGTELMVQRAGAESVGRLFQCPVSGFANDAVHQQPPMLLKRPHRVVELLVEDVERDMLSGGELLVGVEVPQRGERSPNLGDRCAAVPPAQPPAR